jgi:IS4 transposase
MFAVGFGTGLRCDQTVRLVRSRSLLFLTNQFELPARTVAELYHRRWQVRLFFK